MKVVEKDSKMVMEGPTKGGLYRLPNDLKVHGVDDLFLLEKASYYT